MDPAQEKQLLVWLEEIESEDAQNNVEVLEEDSEESDVDNVENNEEESDDEEEVNVESSISNEAYYLGKDGITKWRKVGPRDNIRTRSFNFVSAKPGVK